MIRDGWKSVGKVFTVALVLDVAYQIVVSRFVYSGEALIIGRVDDRADLILRGLVNRLASMK